MRFGIVGFGRAGIKHQQAIESLGHKLVAVCDTHIEMLETFPLGLYRFLDYKDLLKEDLEVVSICTPPSTHKQIAIACANAGKHIILEKPMALSVKDAREIIDICRKMGVKLAVCHQLRFNPNMQKIKDSVLNGEFGPIITTSATVRRKRDESYYQGWLKEFGGGSLLNQGLHALDQLIWLAGSVKSVFSYMDTYHDIQTEDTTTAVLKFDNGAIGNFYSTTCIKRDFLVEDKIMIGGAKETVLIDPMFKDGHKLLIQNMIDAIHNDMEPMVNGNEGLKALEVALAMHKSFDDGNEVFV